MRPLALIDDDLVMQALIQEIFAPRQVVCFNHFADLSQSVSRLLDFDGVLIDLHLPDGHGLEFLSKIGRQGVTDRVACFVISADKDIAKKLAAFQMGAEDYITKPFDPMEMKARVEARIRKMQGSSETVRRGNSSINFSERSLDIWEGNKLTRIEFTDREWRVLSCLLTREGRIYSRDALLEHVWPGVAVSDRTIDAHIVKLRRKLEGSCFKIKTHPGHGYSLSSE